MTKALNALHLTILVGLIASLVFIGGAYVGMRGMVTLEEYNESLWLICVLASDGTDAALHNCDALYDPNEQYSVR